METPFSRFIRPAVLMVLLSLGAGPETQPSTQEQIARLRAENAELRKKIQDISAILKQLESSVAVSERNRPRPAATPEKSDPQPARTPKVGKIATGMTLEEAEQIVGAKAERVATTGKDISVYVLQRNRDSYTLYVNPQGKIEAVAGSPGR